MRLLTFLKESETSVPPLFQETFAPEQRVMGIQSSGAGFESLQCPQGEGALSVRFSLDSALPGAVELDQIHSNLLWEAGTFSGRPMGDGLVFAGQAQAAPLLSIRTADCLAVAFSASVGSLVFTALVHAGWRGFCHGIHLEALHWLEQRAQSFGVETSALWAQLNVFVAPAIFGATYECGDDVRDALANHHQARSVLLPKFADVANVWSACADVKQGLVRRIHPDFQLLACCELLAAGVSADRVAVLRENTWGSSLLFSYRHACLNGLERGRRMVTHLGPTSGVP